MSLDTLRDLCVHAYISLTGSFYLYNDLAAIFEHYQNYWDCYYLIAVELLKFKTAQA